MHKSNRKKIEEKGIQRKKEGKRNRKCHWIFTRKKEYKENRRKRKSDSKEVLHRGLIANKYYIEDSKSMKNTRKTID